MVCGPNTGSFSYVVQSPQNEASKQASKRPQKYRLKTTNGSIEMDVDAMIPWASCPALPASVLHVVAVMIVIRAVIEVAARLTHLTNKARLEDTYAVKLAWIV